MLLATPPFAPSVLHALHGQGIFHTEDLRRADPCRVFLLLKQQQAGLTRSVFWHLAAAADGCTAPELDAARREWWQRRLRDCPPVAQFPPQAEMETLMRAALAQARQAAEAGEVPVGAVAVHNGRIIAAAHNGCIGGCHIGLHAEMRVLAQAGQVLQNYRLNECDVYVSLEPCCMCAGALIQARVRRVVYAAAEPKTGAAGSVLDVFAERRLNTHTAVLGGVLADEAQALLQQFFRQQRG